MTAIHEVTPREVRDLPILDAETWLVVPRARVECPGCGPTVEAVAWLDRYQRMTTRLAEAIARLAQVLPIKHVARWYGVGWDTVKQIHRRALAARLEPVDLTGVQLLAIDEFALRRGAQYATVVLDPLRKRVLWVGRGRGSEELRPFFTLLGAAGCAAVQAVVMDMSRAYTWPPLVSLGLSLAGLLRRQSTTLRKPVRSTSRRSMRACFLLVTVILPLAPVPVAAQLDLGWARPPAVTSPFAFVSVNGRCTDLSGFIIAQTKGWSLNTRATVGGSIIDLRAIFNPDPNITFTGTTANPSLTATTYAFLFGTRIVPDLYSLAVASVQFSTSSVAGTTTIANSGTYPTYISGYGSAGTSLTNLGVDAGSTKCVASGVAASSTCAAEQRASSFGPNFYDNLEGLVTYTQDNTLSTATFTGNVTLDKVTQITAAPEPSPVALVGTGLFLLGARLSRRRRRSRA